MMAPIMPALLPSSAAAGGISGGGSDGNFTGAIGVPTLDGLGVAGDKYHTLEEHIEIDSLSMRGKMMAGLLMGINHDL